MEFKHLLQVIEKTHYLSSDFVYTNHIKSIQDKLCMGTVYCARKEGHSTSFVRYNGILYNKIRKEWFVLEGNYKIVSSTGRILVSIIKGYERNEYICERVHYIDQGINSHTRYFIATRIKLIKGPKNFELDNKLISISEDSLNIYLSNSHYEKLENFSILLEPYVDCIWKSNTCSSKNEAQEYFEHNHDKNEVIVKIINGKYIRITICKRVSGYQSVSDRDGGSYMPVHIYEACSAIIFGSYAETDNFMHKLISKYNSSWDETNNSTTIVFNQSICEIEKELDIKFSYYYSCDKDYVY